MDSAEPRGFTLIELMVALFITAIVFAMGYGAVNQALNNREATSKSARSGCSPCRPPCACSRRISTSSRRAPVRDPAGDSLAARAESADKATQPYRQFTRGGWANPAGMQRPALQRVTYSPRGQRSCGASTGPCSTRCSPARLVKRELLDGVKSVHFRYMDVSRQWRDQWPPQAVAGARSCRTCVMRPSQSK